MGYSRLMLLGLFVVLGVVCSRCLAAPQVRSLNYARSDNGNNRNSINRHGDNGDNGRHNGNNGKHNGNANGHNTNGWHLGHHDDTNENDQVQEPEPQAPPRHKESQRVTTWEEWLATWERSQEHCGYPGSTPFLKDLRIATPPHQQHTYAKLGNYPWMVSFKWNYGLEQHFWCGGALISDQWVLTAAHCLFSTPPMIWGERYWSVHLGALNISVHEETEQVSRIMVHPEWDEHMLFTRGQVGTPSDHDLALVKLVGRAEVSPWVRPVCLPEPQAVPETGEPCVVTGWGFSADSRVLSSILKQAVVPIMNYDMCQALEGYHEWLTDNMLCAGKWAGGVDACQFDSGGPLQCQYGEQWTLAGVVSWGDKNGPGCAQPLRPGVYTRVDTHISWIQETIYADYAGLPQKTWEQVLSNPYG